jgi:hypothetical protein
MGGAISVGARLLLCFTKEEHFSWLIGIAALKLLKAFLTQQA